METKDRPPGTGGDGGESPASPKRTPRKKAAKKAAGATTPRRGRYYGHSDSKVEHDLHVALGAEPLLAGVDVVQQHPFEYVLPADEEGDDGSLPAVSVMLADFYIPAALLVVEVDGYTFHYMERVFTLDRWKDRVHALAGRRVLRFTAKDVTADPAACARTVGVLAASLLERGEAECTP